MSEGRARRQTKPPRKFVDDDGENFVISHSPVYATLEFDPKVIKSSYVPFLLDPVIVKFI